VSEQIGLSLPHPHGHYFACRSRTGGIVVQESRNLAGHKQQGAGLHLLFENKTSMV
jgi:hypothetical protein